MKHFKISSKVVFEVSGKDSARYLNARLTNDLKNLKVGGACLAAALTAQGKTQALFQVCHLESDKYYLVCDGGKSEELLNAIKQFIVADRVDVKDITSSFELYHVIDSKEELAALGVPSEGEFTVKSDLFLVPRKRAPQAGADIISPVGSNLTAKLLANSEEINPIEQALLRLRGGIPSFPEELNSSEIFPFKNLEDVICHKKGCYVGQEVIERISSQGKPPKLLVRIVVNSVVELNGMEVVGARDKDGSSSLGRVTSWVQDRERGQTLSLAYIRNIEGLEKMALLVDGHPGAIG